MLSVCTTAPTGSLHLRRLTLPTRASVSGWRLQCWLLIPAHRGPSEDTESNIDQGVGGERREGGVRGGEGRERGGRGGSKGMRKKERGWSEGWRRERGGGEGGVRG